jgi:hypothetical protein
MKKKQQLLPFLSRIYDRSVEEDLSIVVTVTTEAPFPIVLFFFSQIS